MEGTFPAILFYATRRARSTTVRHSLIDRVSPELDRSAVAAEMATLCMQSSRSRSNMLLVVTAAAITVYFGPAAAGCAPPPATRHPPSLRSLPTPAGRRRRRPCPRLSARSGIADVKTYLNGIDVPGALLFRTLALRGCPH